MLTLVLVVLVIFLFLRNVSATIIPSLALPMSLIGTFAVMYVLGLQPRQPVADGAHALGRLRRGRRDRHAREHRPSHGEGRSRCSNAALDGSREIGFTIMSMTISLVAVFIPMLFLGGIVGRLFHEFAVTIGASILVSGFVSLTLTPMLCSRFLQPHARREARPVLRDHRGRVRAHARRSTSARSLGDGPPPDALAFSASFCSAPSCSFAIVPKGFMPSEDTAQLSATTETAQGTSFDDMVGTRGSWRRSCRPTRTSRASCRRSARAAATRRSNQGRFFMHLKDRRERTLERRRHRARAARASCRAFPACASSCRIRRRSRSAAARAKSLYQFTLQAPDIATLYHYAGDHRSEAARDLRTSPT